MGKRIQLGVENKQWAGGLAENFLISLSSTPGYEASGAFYRIETPHSTAEVDARRWGGRIKTIVLQNPSEYD